MKQFIYKLNLIPTLLDDKNWTAKENEIVARHFNRLQEFTNKGKVILAGRTLTNDADGFGIVIFESHTEEEALDFMNQDPAVKEGIMTSKLFPYRVALIRNE
ncbi:YciI family protein [Bacillus timonensis]|nr:YciI family protein [Bacillus timonensis]